MLPTREKTSTNYFSINIPPLRAERDSSASPAHRRRRSMNDLDPSNHATTDRDVLILASSSASLTNSGKRSRVLQAFMFTVNSLLALLVGIYYAWICIYRNSSDDSSIEASLLTVLITYTSTVINTALAEGVNDAEVDILRGIFASNAKEAWHQRIPKVFGQLAWYVVLHLICLSACLPVISTGNDVGIHPVAIYTTYIMRVRAGAHAWYNGLKILRSIGDRFTKDRSYLRGSIYVLSFIVAAFGSVWYAFQQKGGVNNAFIQYFPNLYNRFPFWFKMLFCLVSAETLAGFYIAYSAFGLAAVLITIFCDLPDMLFNIVTNKSPSSEERLRLLKRLFLVAFPTAGAAPAIRINEEGSTFMLIPAIESSPLYISLAAWVAATVSTLMNINAINNRNGSCALSEFERSEVLKLSEIVKSPVESPEEINLTPELINKIKEIRVENDNWKNTLLFSDEIKVLKALLDNQGEKNLSAKLLDQPLFGIFSWWMDLTSNFVASLLYHAIAKPANGIVSVAKNTASLFCFYCDSPVRDTEFLLPTGPTLSHS